MNILAIDSATEACSVALAGDTGTFSRFQETARGHSQLLLSMIAEVLGEAGLTRSALTHVAFTRGPGSFTGVRIAAGVAQGLALGLGLPLAPVSSLAAIAQRAHREFGAVRVAAAIDARMGEVYWGAYELNAAGVMEPVLDEAVSPPEQVARPPGRGWRGYGTGWASYPRALQERLGDSLEGSGEALLPSALDLIPMARMLIESGATVGPAEAQPVYLRDRVTG
ncbi:tRNA (adenosine(37)-N6)-threonylcarbamoyltransferase complex dimerization subunit type 1 TsaB [Ectothiorhodospiraceae bacterium WFHF3C12]|nr:tRNA (adenosine(37)-N6)-threonylcarbamoyltransferase complex dimerization subunit type 1 TsaB [Ectothiorhodospiraceae bacterium WFHF3C12]